MDINTKKMDGYYDDGVPKYFGNDNDDLIIFQSQYNIGREIITRAVNVGVLKLDDPLEPDGKRKFKDINMLFMGPTYTNLQKQTKNDLNCFLHGRTKLSVKKIDSICENCVVNSSSSALDEKNFDKMLFVRILNENPINYLHIIVLDEAHWGIKNESRIEKFFQYLVKQVEELQKNNGQKSSLIILLVSATIDVLTRVVDKFKKNNRIDWGALRQDERFCAPTYKGIMELQLCNDKNSFRCSYTPDGGVTTPTCPTLMGYDTLEGRSVHVVKEYLYVLGLWKSVFERMPTNDHWNWKSLAAYDLVKYLLPFNQIYDEEYVDTNNYKTVLVRLKRIEDVEDLYKHVKGMFALLQIQPFEVIQFKESLEKELSDKALRYLRKQDEHFTPSSAGQLNKLPCLFLVVDKLAVGERLPSNCMVYDVRARYKGDLTKMDGIESTFIQDIGRCAGHGKPETRVHMSVGEPEGGSLRMKDLMFFKKHALLSKIMTPTSNHPERGYACFSKLDSYTIVLDAEPQIGKTGALMAMLDIFYTEHTTMSKPLSEQSVSAVADSFEPFSQSLPLPAPTNSSRDYSNYYNEEDKAALSSNIFDFLCVPLVRCSKNLAIVVCGCGLDGIVHILQANSSKFTSSVHVTGIVDLHESIVLSQQNLSDEKITTEFFIGDMCFDAIDKNYANVVIYSLSLFEKDVTRRIEWAYQRLKQDGYIIIADGHERFPKGFKDAMKETGFCYHSGSTRAPFTVWVFQKEIQSAHN